MTEEEKFIRALISPNGDNPKHFAIDLLTEKYDIATLIAEAKRQKAVQQLGYLADATFEAAGLKGLKNRYSCLSLIVEKLQKEKFKKWQFLSPDLPDWGKDLVSSDPTELNKKWKVYAHVEPADVADWIDLYITQEYATTPQR